MWDINYYSNEFGFFGSLLCILSKYMIRNSCGEKIAFRWTYILKFCLICIVCCLLKDYEKILMRVYLPNSYVLPGNVELKKPSLLCKKCCLFFNYHNNNPTFFKLRCHIVRSIHKRRLFEIHSKKAKTLL